MITTTPMGPGFFIFFQRKTEHYSWKKESKGKKKDEISEILLLLTAMYESGTFN